MERVEVRVSATADQVAMPWLWQLSRQFNARVVLKRATVDTDAGWYVLELEGDVEEIQRATAWLMTTGMSVEAQSRALGA
jgi:hypothetical protein